MWEALKPGMSAAEVLRALEQAGIPCVRTGTEENAQLYCDLRLFGAWEGRAKLDVSRRDGLYEISWVPDYGRFTQADGEALAGRMERRYGPSDDAGGRGCYWKETAEWLVSVSDGFAVWTAL